MKSLHGSGQPAAGGPEAQFQPSAVQASSLSRGDPIDPLDASEAVGWASRSHFAQRPAPMA